MACLRRMQKYCRAANGTESGGNLARNMPGFSDPGDDHRILGTVQQPQRSSDFMADPGCVANKGGGFGFEHLTAQRQQG